MEFMDDLGMEFMNPCLDRIYVRMYVAATMVYPDHTP